MKFVSSKMLLQQFHALLLVISSLPLIEQNVEIDMKVCVCIFFVTACNYVYCFINVFYS